MTRTARTDDAAAIAAVYNEGIADRVATFETEPRSAAQITRWFDGHHPVVVVESDGAVVAFASSSSYRDRNCYAGIAEILGLRRKVTARHWRRTRCHGCSD